MASEVGAKFKTPPVIERVVGLQMDPIPGWTSAHAGIYSKAHLRPQSSWNQLSEHPPIPPQFERFDGITSAMMQNPFELFEGHHPRIWITSVEGERLIQIQPSRFHLNWRRRSSEYPPYEALRTEFDGYFESFRAFLIESDMPPPVPNQWEVTYIDHIPKGSGWDTPSDWKGLIPALSSPIDEAGVGTLESSVQKWAFRMPDDAGRIHIDASHGFDLETKAEMLILTLTARGPIRGSDYRVLLDRGHDAVVSAFLAITSREAHLNWGRQ